jgi:uncharacterized membrane protein
MERAVLAGTSATFQVRVINLRNDTRDFEMDTEDLPSSWSISYSSDDGVMQGDLFVFEINGSGEVIVDFTILTSSSGPFGSLQLGTYVRSKGEVEKKWLYPSFKVVDDSRDVVNIPSSMTRQTSQRIGSEVPIKYSNVHFMIQIYNPTLVDTDVDILVDGPDGWNLESDYDDIRLAPGEGSQWNLTVTPGSGESWNSGAAYMIDVTFNAGASGEYSKRLEVELPEVSVVNVQKEWSSVDTVEGRTLPLNITFENNGNRDENIRISLDTPPELQINITPESRTISPGERFTARGQISVGDVDEAGTLTFTLRYSTAKGEKSVDYSLSIEKKASSSGVDLVLLGIIVAVATMIAVAGFFIYTRFFSKTAPKGKGGEKGAPKTAPPITISAFPERKEPSAHVKPVKESEVVKEADDALASILGEESQPAEKVEVVEATVVE